jgi:hypothetical protein
MTERDDETIRHLSGGKISRMPEPVSQPTPAIDPHALAKAVQLSGTNTVRYSQRGRGWAPLELPPEEIDWSREDQ